MDIQRIEIDIDDNWKYTQLALLVDRDDFLRDLYKIRQELNLTRLIPPDRLFEYEIAEMKRHDFVKRKYTEVKTITSYRTECLRSESLVFDLIRKYRRDDAYFRAIYTAVITGRTTENTVLTNTASCALIFPEYYYYQVGLGYKDPQIAILLSPESSRKDVIAAYKEGFQKVLEEYKHRMRMQYRNPILVDTVSNIKRDREWYWQNKNGKGYMQLAKRNIKDHMNISDSIKFKDKVQMETEVIRKAIVQYKKNLTIPISIPET